MFKDKKFRMLNKKEITSNIKINVEKEIKELVGNHYVDREFKEGLRDQIIDQHYNNYLKIAPKIIQKRKDKVLRRIKISLSSIKSNSKKQNIKFNLDIEWYLEKFKLGCELTKIPFEYILNKKDKNPGPYSPYQPSIDRINPKQGYTKDNCRLILYCLNLFKMQFDDEHMYNISEKLLNIRMNP